MDLNYSPLMLSVHGPNLGMIEQIDKSSVKSVCGYILFSQNFTSKTQLKKLTNNIKNSRERFDLPPPIIAVDQEGGKVQRFVGNGFTKLPYQQVIGDLYLKDKSEALQLIADIGLVISAELGSCGVNLCLGPSLDLNTNHATQVTHRSYSDKKEIIMDLSSVLLKTMKIHGMNATGKHYPGFGAAKEDTHTHSPIINLSLKEVLNSHLEPFKENIQKDLLPCIMLTHGTYYKIDNMPVPKSKFWLQSYLRDKLKYSGIIITDCLAMIAASPLGSTYVEKINNCLKSGCDIALITHTQNSLHKVIKKLQNNDEFRQYSSSEIAISSTKRKNILLENYKNEKYYNDLVESNSYIQEFRTLLN